MMENIKLIAVMVAAFFAPTLILLMMFTIFGLQLQPDEGGIIILTIVGLFSAYIAFAVSME